MPLPNLPAQSPVIDKLIKEMFDTEESYLLPLQAFMEATKGSQFAGNVIIQRQRTQMQELITLSSAVLSLTEGMTKQPTIDEIADFFEKNAKRFAIYEPYAADYSEYQKLLDEKLEAGPGAAINKNLIAGNLGSLNAVAIAITPIQRIPRYLMLLKEMQKQPLGVPSELPKLSNAIEAISTRATAINEAIRTAEIQSVPEYVAQKEKLIGLLNVVFDNPKQLSGILATLGGNVEQAQTPETKGMPEIKGETSVPKSSFGFFKKAKVAAKGVVLGVQNPVASIGAIKDKTFYKKELGKVKAIFQGYDLVLESEIGISAKGKKQYLAGKIYISDNGNSYACLDLKGTLKKGNFTTPVEMSDFVSKKKDRIFKSSILAMLPQGYIYIYNPKNPPPFFITLLNDKKFIDFIKSNSSKTNKLIPQLAVMLESAVALPGIDTAFITQALPVATKIADSFSEKTPELKAIFEYAVMDPSLRNESVNARLVANVSSLAQAFEKNPVLTTDLPNFLLENKLKIQSAVKEVVKNQEDLPGYIDDTLVELLINSLPVLSKVVEVSLTKPEDATGIIQHLTSPKLVISRTVEENTKLFKHLSGVVSALQAPNAKVIQELQKYLNLNRVEIRAAVKMNLSAIPVPINPELVDSIIDGAIDLSPSLLPLVMNFSKAFLDQEKTPEVLTKLIATESMLPKILPVLVLLIGVVKKSLTAPALDALGQNPAALAELSYLALKLVTLGDEQEKIAVQIQLLNKIANLDLKTEQSIGALTALKEFFSAPESIDKLSAITDSMLEMPLLKARLVTFGIDKELIVDALPIVGETLGVLLTKVTDLQSIYKNSSLNENFLTPISHIRDSLQQHENIFTEKLPTYIDEHELMVIKVVGQNLGLIREKLNIPSDFSDDFIVHIAEVGIKVSQDLIPFAFKAASAVLEGSPENQTAVLDIMRKVNIAFTPIVVTGINGEPVGAEQIEEQNKKKEKDIRILVDAALGLKNKNPQLKEVIDKALPDILAKHSELLGGVMDEFINKTQLGKYIDIKAKAYLEVASRNVPKLIEVAALYNNKQYARMLMKASTLLFEKGVLVLIGKIMMRALSYQYQATSQSGFRRRFRAQRSIQRALSSALDQRGDLGVTLSALSLSDNSTLNYSLINKDFRDLHFSFKPEVNFSNCILDGFYFNNAKLNTSFEGATITNCDFKDVVFTAKVSFTDAKIDSQTLQTLLPAIDAYNTKHKKHPEEQITKNYTIILTKKKEVKQQKP